MNAASKVIQDMKDGAVLWYSPGYAIDRQPRIELRFPDGSTRRIQYRTYEALRPSIEIADRGKHSWNAKSYKLRSSR